MAIDNPPGFRPNRRTVIKYSVVAAAAAGLASVDSPLPASAEPTPVPAPPPAPPAIGAEGADGRPLSARISAKSAAVTAAADPAVTSYNGWPVGTPGSAIGVQTFGVPGTGVVLPIRSGTVATVLLYVAQRFNNEVEGILPGQCWGYSYRKNVNNPNVWSNHASGTAIDLNSAKHPNGATGTFTAAQVGAIRRILKTCDDVVYWGGDYTGTVDAMHFEIDVAPGDPTLAALSASINGSVGGIPPTAVISAAGTGYVFWRSRSGNLWQSSGNPGNPSGSPQQLGYAPLGSAPTAIIDSAGATYVYWTGSTGALWQAYWTGTRWSGALNRGMGPLGSAPSAAMRGNGPAWVFWKGADSNLWYATGSPKGALSGPGYAGCGPLNSGPAAAVAPDGTPHAFWQGADGGLWQTFFDGARWRAPISRGMGPLDSPPSAVIDNNGIAHVFWRGSDGNIWHSLGDPRGTMSGPYTHGCGPLGSTPTVAVNSSGSTYVYWVGQNGALWTAYWTGSTWTGASMLNVGPG